jgi:hypothetical protein
MSGKRQKTQYSLALEPRDRGEAPVSGHQGAEPLVAKSAPESSAWTEQLMETVCSRENLETAWKRVRSNKGGPGVDGMTIDDAKGYLREHWPSIRSRLLKGTYQPQPVKRVEIPKPDGGVRKLGVPCVVDIPLSLHASLAKGSRSIHLGVECRPSSRRSERATCALRGERYFTSRNGPDRVNARDIRLALERAAAETKA